jgi:centrosomal protein CEP76
MAQRFRAFNRSLQDFPVKKGKKFRACPIHFSTADIEFIRGFLAESREYQKMIEWPDDKILYSVQIKIFPLLGGILSVWFVMATQTAYDEPFFE